MKLMIVNDENVQTLIKPEQIVVKGITLDKLFANFQSSFKEFKDFKSAAEKRERELIATWEKIK